VRRRQRNRGPNEILVGTRVIQARGAPSLLGTRVDLSTRAFRDGLANHECSRLTYIPEVTYLSARGVVMKSVAFALGISFALFACTSEVAPTAESAPAAAVAKKDVEGTFRAEDDAKLAGHDIYQISIDKHLDCESTVVDPGWFGRNEAGGKTTIKSSDLHDMKKKDFEVATIKVIGCRIDLDKQTLTLFVQDDPTGEDDSVRVDFDLDVTDGGNLKVKRTGGDKIKLEKR
jgi:hypothetical protein